MPMCKRQKARARQLRVASLVAHNKLWPGIRRTAKVLMENHPQQIGALTRRWVVD